MLTTVRHVFETLRVEPPEGLDATVVLRVALRVGDVGVGSVFIGNSKYRNDSESFARKAVRAGASYSIVGGSSDRRNVDSDSVRIYRVGSTSDYLARLLLATISDYQELADTLKARIREGVSIFNMLQRSGALPKSDPGFASIIGAVEPTAIRHPVLRDLEARRTAITQAISFHRTMIELSEARRIGAKSVDWALDHKRRAYDFCDMIGVRRPACSDTKPLKDTVEEIKELKRFPAVLKPSRSTGSRGVVVINREDYMVEVKTGLTFASIDEVYARYAPKIEARARGFRVNEWYMEEMVHEDREGRIPARDVKYYTFYGEVALVLEVIRRDGKAVYCLWSPDGTHITDSGKYQDEDWVGDWTPPFGLKAAADVSLQIPSPFMRLDFLRSHDGLVLGEFTCRPGQFDEFNAKYDRMLGERYQQARSRLFLDLLNGKPFDDFKLILQ